MTAPERSRAGTEKGGYYMGRNAKGTGTIRKVTKTVNGKTYTYWEGQITIGINPGNGKQQRKTFTGKTQKEVRERMQEAAVSVNEGTFFEPSKMTVREWFEVWLSEYMGDKKPLTVQQYRSMSETHIFPAIGAVKLSTLTAPQIQKLYNDLAKHGRTTKKSLKTGKVETVKTDKPLSAKSIRNIHGIISKALNTAMQQGLIRSNAAQLVTVPKVIQSEVQPLTEEQQKAFFTAIQNHDFKNLYTVMIFTGLREGEAVGLTWDCIDFKKGTMKVYRQLQRTPGKWSEWRFAPLKNSKTRTIKLSPFVVKLLEQQKRERKVVMLSTEEDADFVFTNEQGQHLHTETVYNNFKRIAAQIGAPGARVHDLRHTFAVISLQNGDDYKTVQDALGHATAAFTLNVYGHVSERMMEEHAARQQEYIKALGL